MPASIPASGDSWNRPIHWFAPYAASFSTAWRRQFSYRAANWAGFFTNTFFLFFRVAVMVACYGQVQGSVGGFNAQEAVAYMAISQALLMVIPQWGNMGISDDVRSGQIAVELARPADFLGLFLARRMGVSAYYMLMRCLPVLGVSLLAGFLVMPSSLGLMLGAVSIVLGAVVAQLILFLVELSSFWLGDDRGVYRIAIAVSSLAGGLILPISFFPEWAQTLSKWLPFQYGLYVPVRIALGLDGAAGMFELLLAQALWALGLYVFARFLLNLGTRKLIIHGG